MRIAIVGTGISGLASAWLLDRHHEVHVFEREDRLGGHTHTVDVDPVERRGTSRRHDAARPATAVPVDTGFIVYNEPTYPNLTRLFDELEVETTASDMSWALRCEHHDLEYAGNARGLVAQPRNLADPGYRRMIADILRFNRLGRSLVDDPRTARVTLGRLTRAAGFGPGFRDHYLLPMAAAIWSTGTGDVEDFPLETLLTFFDNHGLLGITTHHPWRTVVGGTSSYVPKLTAGYRDRVHAGDAVVAVTRDPDGVELRLASGVVQRFDEVVIATHADEALGLLTDPSPDEKELLGLWSYSVNETYLHTDRTLMPRTPAAWASWNYLLEDCRTGAPTVSLSYHMNRLSSLDTDEDYLVTLNPTTPPAPETVIRRMTYRHPTYTPETTASQAQLRELSGRQRTFYAGAYHRYGFHEDGLVSALHVAAHFGIRW